jgi:4-carboxymuconolactone decarboxylase
VARIKPLELDKLTPEQKELHARVGRGRNRVIGPFSVWIHNPPLADAASRLINAVRENGKLDNRLYELIVLTVARRAEVEYAFAVHEPIALAAGLAPDVLEAIRARKKPTFARPDEGLAYEAVTALLETGKLPEPTYQALLKQFGLDLTIELVTVVGIYGMIGTVLNAFEVPTPNGERPFA